jgi:hypothetical protein
MVSIVNMSTLVVYSSLVASPTPRQKRTPDGNSVAYSASQALRRGLSDEQIKGSQELQRLQEDSLKQVRICGRGSSRSEWLGLIAIFCRYRSNSARSAQTQLAASGGTGAAAPVLSAEGQAWLHSAISSGHLPDLRWPDFSDYSKHVNKFYELKGDSLWWVKGMESTAQGAASDCTAATSRPRRALRRRP